MSSSPDEDDFMMWQLLRRNRRKLRYWVQPYYDGCYTKGNFEVAKQLVDEVEKFKSYYRLLLITFNFLLELVGPGLKKENTKFRESVSAEERLFIILR